MKISSFLTADCLLLFFFLSLFWRPADSNSTLRPGSTLTPTVSPSASPETTITTVVTTPLPTKKTPPENVKSVEVVSQTETSITLQWDKVNNITEYNVSYCTNVCHMEPVPWTDYNPVRHTIVSLTAGRKYNMTVYTYLDGVISTGYDFNATTAPQNVQRVEVVSPTETSVILQWDKVDNITQYNVSYCPSDCKVEIATWNGNNPVRWPVTSLTAGRKYNMTLYTYLDGLSSTGYDFNATTAPENVKDFRAVDQNVSSITLQWTKISDILHYTLKFDEVEKNLTVNEQTEPVQYVVTDLNSQTRYSFNLFTVFEGVRSTGVNLSAATAPPKAEEFQAIAQNETSITLQWRKLNDGISYTLKFNETEKNFTAPQLTNPATHTVLNLQSATKYSFTLFTVFDNIRGSGVDVAAATAPYNAQAFGSAGQDENSITLQWQPVHGVSDYIIEFNQNETRHTESTAVISNLMSGTIYNFTLYAVFENVRSSGTPHTAATAPPAVSSVKVTERTLTTITLEWERIRKDWTYLLKINDNTVLVPNGDSNTISYLVNSLKPGTKYLFRITTQFYGINSTTYEKLTVTVIDCAIINWHVTDSSISGVVEGAFTKATANNGSQEHVSSGSNTVSFTDLYPGATYNMVLMYGDLEQCSHNLTIIPPRLAAECKNRAGGYSIYIVWDKPNGVWNSVEVNVANQMHVVGENGEQYAEIPHFQPARKYEVTISTLSGSQRSQPYVFMCATDARGVIAGSIFGVLLFGILICVVFIVLKRPDAIRRKKPLISGSNSSVERSRSIPVAKFPSHFDVLSADENRGFSEEYENLSPVGTEQTQKAAHVPENKAKNRFINVLPYDRSRVKLTSSNPHDDYINASYMPGYKSDRQYIAAQGPMPSTVNDFWRMIWEHKTRGIVMVTNCTEGGRTKCEQYWPEDTMSRVCGDLLVFTTSEQKESNWTLRDFKLTHRHTSEERTVRHFHFNAWPDHGVPLGTEVLIQFRGLVRRHIQTASGTPTVVHCSAGVGRTGTIIALDVLLQQLEKEKAVDINGFVHKMRLNRPHMVQTESQYVFLHQCIMDCLQPSDDNIYENMDLIYANATALREFHNNNTN